MTKSRNIYNSGIFGNLKHLLLYFGFKTRNKTSKMIKPHPFSEKAIAIIKMDGGLASQMWQYAIGQSIMIKSGQKVKYDLTWFKKNGRDINNKQKRALEIKLAFPSLELEEASTEETLIYKKKFYVFPFLNCLFDESIIVNVDPKYIGGYLCNVKYINKFNFFDHFTSDINPENKLFLEKIKDNCPSVAIHIRRGDYVRSIHDVTSPTYFKNAIEKIQCLLSPEKPTFFVFSDDMDYAQEITSTYDNLNMFFVDINHNDSGRYDMYLMHHCDHHIISNSVFGWWPAYLKQDSQHITIIPSRWFTKKASFFLRYNSENAYVFPGCVKIEN